MNNIVAELVNHYGVWGQHPDHTRDTWRDWLSTEPSLKKSYWDWVVEQLTVGS